MSDNILHQLDQQVGQISHLVALLNERLAAVRQLQEIERDRVNLSAQRETISSRQDEITRRIEEIKSALSAGGDDNDQTLRRLQETSAGLLTPSSLRSGTNFGKSEIAGDFPPVVAAAGESEAGPFEDLFQEEDHFPPVVAAAGESEAGGSSDEAGPFEDLFQEARELDASSDSWWDDEDDILPGSDNREVIEDRPIERVAETVQLTTKDGRAHQPKKKGLLGRFLVLISAIILAGGGMMSLGTAVAQDNAASLPSPTTAPTTTAVRLVTPTPTAEPTTSARFQNGPIVLVVNETLPTPTGPDEETPLPTPTTKTTGLRLPTRPEIIPVTETYTSEVEPGVLQWDVPRSDAGRHYNTPNCGEVGNTIVVGHSVWYEESGVFAPLLDVNVGDTIACGNDNGQEYDYRVVRKWSSPYEDGSWLIQPEDKQSKLLTLYTCNLELTNLVVVQAELVD